MHLFVLRHVRMLVCASRITVWACNIPHERGTWRRSGWGRGGGGGTLSPFWLSDTPSARAGEQGKAFLTRGKEGVVCRKVDPRQLGREQRRCSLEFTEKGSRLEGKGQEGEYSKGVTNEPRNTYRELKLQE